MKSYAQLMSRLLVIHEREFRESYVNTHYGACDDPLGLIDHPFVDAAWRRYTLSREFEVNMKPLRAEASDAATDKHRMVASFNSSSNLPALSEVVDETVRYKRPYQTACYDHDTESDAYFRLGARLGSIGGRREIPSKWIHAHANDTQK